MLTLKALLSIPAVLSTAILAHALATPEFIRIDPNDVNSTITVSLTGGERCKKKELRAIHDGFVEMTQLFQAATKLDWNGPAERDFFGTRERLGNYTALVEGNLRRASQYPFLDANTTQIHVRCDDPLEKCRECSRKDGNHVAYNIGNEAHINFCDSFSDMPMLNIAVDTKSSLDMLAYYNRATIWARQLMHISNVGVGIVEKAVADSQSGPHTPWRTYTYTGPLNTSALAGVADDHPDTKGPNNIRALKYAYGVNRAKLLAVLSTQMPYDALNNPENYALYAQARYVMNKKGFYPNLPVMQFDDEMAVLANEQLQDGPRPRFGCFIKPDVA
ncbi:hypothetical protein BCR34DRAFT_548379 [Clohesyomyces aquaticus]|uniref:Uncharacterized protein n=1 Tax=Clohesyomyces aquaticus TaxID=1231657 RepID=A0A1Y1YIN7_9PLEO|nr:hypothetical protein BCR34DRAFT_548379 [Clohesyomyces aquaticus]